MIYSHWVQLSLASYWLRLELYSAVPCLHFLSHENLTAYCSLFCFSAVVILQFHRCKHRFLCRPHTAYFCYLYPLFSCHYEIWLVIKQAVIIQYTDKLYLNVVYRKLFLGLILRRCLWYT
jgi:hypothetical protein